MIEQTEDGATSKEAFSALMESFRTGWEKGKTDEITGIFSDDGRLVIDPFSAPLVGKEAIAGYWADSPREQAAISFKFGEIFVAGPWFSTEFRCTFRRRRTGDWMDVRGTMFCETVDGLIVEMRMYWLRERGTDPER